MSAMNQDEINVGLFDECKRLQQEVTQLKETLQEIHECANDFYTEDGNKRLHSTLKPFAGQISIIHRLSNI